MNALRPVLWLVTALTAGCVGKEPPLTTFTAETSKEFTFEARAGMEYPEHSQAAEATRMQWLDEALADHNMCPNGYQITGRTLVAAKEEELGQTHNVAYHGTCK